MWHARCEPQAIYTWKEEIDECTILENMNSTVTDMAEVCTRSTYKMCLPVTDQNRFTVISPVEAFLR